VSGGGVVVSGGTAVPPQSQGIVPVVSVGGVGLSVVTVGGTLSQLHGTVPVVSVGGVTVSVDGVESVETVGGTLSQLHGSVPVVSVGGVTVSVDGVESIETGFEISLEDGSETVDDTGSEETEVEIIPEVSPIDESPLEITSLGLLVTSVSPPEITSGELRPVEPKLPISILPPSVKSSAFA
jgi:hypothetical protein